MCIPLPHLGMYCVCYNSAKQGNTQAAETTQGKLRLAECSYLKSGAPFFLNSREMPMWVFWFLFVCFLVLSEDRFRKVLGFILKAVACRLSHSYTCGFLKP